MSILKNMAIWSVAVVLLTTSCQSSPKAENNKPAPPVNQANSANNANSDSGGNQPDEENFAKLFSGTIGDEDEDGKPKIPPFQMRLKRAGKDLSGVYRYRNSTKDISLKGTIDDENKFVLTESVDGKETGVFDGKLEPDGEGLLKMSGVWSKPKSEDYIGFAADEIPMEMSGNVYVDDKSLIEKNRSYDISISYPQITGAKSPNAAKLNLALKNIAVQHQSKFKSAKPAGGEPFSTEMGYAIHLADDNLFSIEFVDDSFTGGAHPNHGTRTFNFDMKTGKPVQLAELFAPNSKYLEKLSAISLKKIKEDLGDGIFEDGIKPVAKNYSNWVIGKEGLTIYFDEYQAAPYASGRQEVNILYGDIKDIINPNGLIAAFAK